MSADRLVGIHIKGLRSLADVELGLEGLTVLIGENGAGKSSLIEGFELLRKAAKPDYVESLRVHGGLNLLLREGVAELELGVRIEGTEGEVRYSFALASEGPLVAIVRESLTTTARSTDEPAFEIIRRTRSSSAVFDPQANKLIDRGVEPSTLLVSAFGQFPPHRVIARTLAILEAITVHVPFDIRARWVSKELGRPAWFREPTFIEPTIALSRLGDNLANAFHALKNRSSSEWRETMEIVQLGLGEDVAGINTRVAASGQIELTMELRHRGEVPAAAMADGSLAYLAFVALLRLGGARSLLAFDEPELHLHPHLIVRVLGFFETLARQGPVVLATQSDRLLDALPNPAKSTVLCRLTGANGPGMWATKLVRPNAAALGRWLERYRGLGDLRSAGAEDLVMTDE